METTACKTGSKFPPRLPASLASPASQKADLRREITPWGLLVWAYRDECVRAKSGSQEGSFGHTDFVMARYGEGQAPRGTINGFLEPHEDALLIDKIMADWFSGIDQGYVHTARHAEKGVMPVHPDKLERARLVPVLKPNGKPRMMYFSGAAICCELEATGHTPQDIARHETYWDLLMGLLPVLKARAFTRWRVV
ncbi:hypothetical protein [Aestuariivirga litoralis]|uniref:hypothetical protein n=1 Tax=Aestuariivirga litoralis TaxID=2650924 RepID=UPI0018C77C91|nr:hypothetical protein [Aestuariivirga litoralis]MBG1232985.1 hypothetical protein [Aestuariivirga litoralis]